MRTTCHKDTSRARQQRETHAHAHQSHAAFTLPELLIVIAVVAILFAITLSPTTGRFSKEKAHRIRCVNNLKNVGLAFRIYSTDHNDRFPWELPDPKDTNAPAHILYSPDPSAYLLAVTNELSTPKIVICPADKGRPEATNWTQFTRQNLSYFISPDAAENLPQTFFAGDRNITNQNGPLTGGLHSLSTNAIVGWDQSIHKSQGNACMGDGSVQQLSSARLREQLRNTGQTNQNVKFAIP
jgi:prepilin-type N-terminal cleavage/methylation domain-containing protein